MAGSASRARAGAAAYSVETIVPRPDPTTLTTAQLYREISVQDEIFSAKLSAVTDRITTFEAASKASLQGAAEAIQKGLDKAEKGVIDNAAKTQAEQSRALKEAEDRVTVKLGDLSKAFDDKLTGSVEVLSERIRSLTDLTAQQFTSVASTFAEKDKAVSVGLSAQKESAAAQQQANANATEKMEDNFTKLLDQGRELLSEVRRNTELQINDIKSRLDKGEGQVKGKGDVWGWVFGAAAIMIAFAVLVVRH
jgi:hypothetical protein